MALALQVKNRGVLAFPTTGLEQVIEELENNRRIHKNEEIKKLITKMKHNIAVLKDAEKKQLSSEVHRFWLGKLREVAFDAEDLIDELATDAAVQSLGARTYSNPTATRSMMDQIRQMNDRLDYLEPQIAMLVFQLSAVQDSCLVLPTWRQTGSLLPDESSVIGRNGEKEQIIEILLSDPVAESSSNNNKGFSIVPIVGLGGMGKTTLAQLVYNDEKVKKHFELMIWVCVSNNSDRQRLTKEMIEAAFAYKGRHEKCDITNWDSVQQTLRQEVTGKTFLLVLDEVWGAEYSMWEELFKPLHSGKKGSKVLVTARNRAFVNKLGGRMETPIPLGGLSDADIWDVFNKYAFRGNVDADGTTSAEYSHLEDLGSSIVQRLKGSPLAARTIGSLLNLELSEQHWKTVLESEFWKLEQGGEDILPALLLSYQYLPPDLKQCFAYCSLFPKDHRFSREQVVQLWEAQSFIGRDRGAGMGTETMGSKYFEELLHMFFFESKSDHYGDYYVMHDLIHDLAEYVSSDDCFRLESSKHVEIPDTVRHVLVWVARKYQIDITINELCCYENLRTLLFMPRYSFDLKTSVLDQLFLKLKRLRVLGLSKCGIRELPSSIGDLKHLRYLDLQGNLDLENLPESVGNLYNLQLLNLSKCSIRELHRSIGHLKHLRYIDLERNYGLRGLPESLGDLHNLQVLNLSYCQIEELPSSIGHLKHLRDIDLERNYGLRGLPESLGDLHNLQVLNLSYCQIEELPSSIGNLKNLKNINLWGNGDLENLPESFGNLHKLQVLNLDRCRSLRVLPSTMSQLVKLKDLQTYYCDLLSRIDGVGKLTDLQELQARGRQLRELGGMCMLQELKITNLEEVGSKEEAIQARLHTMKHLQVLQLYWSSEDNSSIEWEDSRKLELELEEEVLQALRPNKGIRKLCIGGYGGIKSPNWMEVSTLASFSSLRHVVLKDCPNWQVPPCSFLGQLRHLEYLEINRMPEWEEWSYPVSWDCLQQLTLRGCPRLKELPLLPPMLRSLYLFEVGISCLPELDGCSRVEGGIETTSSPHSPSTSASLYKLHIFFCDNLISIGAHLLQQLPDLVEIEICNCKNLVSLPEKGFGHLISLKILKIIQCPKLTCLLQGEEDAQSQHLPRSLGQLEISLCGDAMGGWWWTGLQRLTSIAKLSLWGCPTTAELLFDRWERHHHPHVQAALRELWIEGCGRGNYEQQSTTFSTCSSHLSTPPPIPHNNADAPARALLAFTSLKELTIRHSPKFLQKWGGCGLPSSLERLTIVGDDNLDHKCLSACLHDLISLQKLTLDHFENLRLLPNLSGLTSLETLFISYSRSIQSWPTSGLPSSLQTLQITRCPALTRGHEDKPKSMWPEVAHIAHVDIDGFLLV